MEEKRECAWDEIELDERLSPSVNRYAMPSAHQKYLNPLSRERRGGKHFLHPSSSDSVAGLDEFKSIYTGHSQLTLKADIFEVG